MKTVITACLALALSVPVMVFAQDSQQPQDQQDQKHMQQESNQAAQINNSGTSAVPSHHMSGMVSEGGKKFVSGDTTYQVENPNSLKNYDNQNVTIRFVFDTDKNMIHVQKVKPGSGQ